MTQTESFLSEWHGKSAVRTEPLEGRFFFRLDVPQLRRTVCFLSTALVRGQHCCCMSLLM